MALGFLGCSSSRFQGVERSKGLRLRMLRINTVGFGVFLILGIFRLGLFA